MIILQDTSETLEVVTTTTAATHVVVSWADLSGSDLTGGSSNSSISSATTTTVVAAPASSTQRQVKFLSIRNTSTTASQGITVQLDDGGNNREMFSCTLAAQETLHYNQDTGFVLRDRTGRERTQATDTIGFTGIPFQIYSVGTAAEAAGQWYGYAKDSGFPGAWVPGSPGVNGWWTDASTASNAANPAGAAQVGCHRLANPSSGSYYLRQPTLATSVGHLVEMVDLIWYNTGLTVTTTTAQAISQPGTSKPARDLYGTTNGDGWNAGIYVTTATTNAGAITNMTLNYTNSDGTSSRTGTISSFPATAVVGTFVPFQLQAGDRGVRSIEGVTLGTSLVTGAISLVMYRTLYSIPNTIANMGAVGQAYTTDPTGVRIYNGTAPWFIYRASATTATTMAGSYQIVER